MVQRSANMRFLPSNYVFPGGGIHEVDFHPMWETAFRETQKSAWEESEDRIERYRRKIGETNFPRPLLFEQYHKG